MYAVEMNKKIYVPIRGTKLLNIRDLGNDIVNIGAGIASGTSGTGRREQTAQKFVKNIIDNHTGPNKKYSKKDIIVTGHSLGGHVAEAVAARHGLQAHTFNAPGVTDASKVKTKYDTIYIVIKKDMMLLDNMEQIEVADGLVIRIG